MVKKPHTSKLLGKIAARTIFKQWLQFLAIILINTVAVTLFVGLCSNADHIKKQTNILYDGSNVADIWTNVTSSVEEDKIAIDTIVGDYGYTETRYSLGAEVGTIQLNALMSEKLPTINAPYECNNSMTENFFIIDSRLYNDPKHPELFDAWVDENNYFRSRDVDFNFANIQNYLKEFTLENVIKDRNEDLYNRIEETIDLIPDSWNIDARKYWEEVKSKNLLNVLNTCVRDGKENILDNSKITLNLQVTGSMMFAENVQSSLMNSSNCLLDINLFKTKFIDLFNENYSIDSSSLENENNYIWKYIISESGILNTVRDSIVNTFTYNTYCTKLVNKEYVQPVKEAIQYYFDSKPAEESNLIICNDIDSLTSNITIQNDIKQARQLAYIFPIVFFLVAILVVLTTFSQLIIKERTQIGTLKAMGVSKERIVLHYIVITAIVIAIGSILGCIIGPLLLTNIMNIKYAILYTLPSLGMVLAVPEALISTSVAILVSCLVTFVVVFKEVRLNPADSMRPAAPRSIKAKAVGNSKKTVGIAINMAFRNIRVSLGKSLMVIVGVMGCTSLLVCGFGIDDTLNKGINHDMEHYYSADISVSYSTIKTHKSEIIEIPGVSAVEEYALLPSTIVGSDSLYSSRVYCIEDNSQFFFGDDGYVFGEDIAITQKEARDLHLKVGDVVEFSVPLIRKENFVGRVGAIFESFYHHGIFLNSSYNDYSEIMELRNNAFVDIEDYSKANEIGEQIKAIDGVLAYKTRDENNETIQSYMSSISLMTLAVKGFAIVLAVIVLYNLALLNFRERNRDIATMKVLGFNQFEIMLSLIIEIMVLTTIGIAFGMLLGMPLEVIVLMVNRTPVVEFLYTVFPVTYVISFLITFGTGLIVNLFLSFKARGVKMVESLKSVD